MIFLIDPDADWQIARFEQMTYALLGGRLMAAELKKRLELREGDDKQLVAILSQDGTVHLNS